MVTRAPLASPYTCVHRGAGHHVLVGGRRSLVNAALHAQQAGIVMGKRLRKQLRHNKREARQRRGRGCGATTVQRFAAHWQPALQACL